MSQLITQMFQAEAVKVKHDLLLFVLQVNQNKTKPLKSTPKSITAWWYDIHCDILDFFMAQRTLVKNGAVHSG